jgi:N-acetylneuraminic acid mutarotase
MIIFGGSEGSGSRLNDVYSLDLSSNAWTQITASGSTPAARSSHTSVLYNGDQMTIFGGWDSSSTNDVYALGDLIVLQGKYNVNTGATTATACIDLAPETKNWGDDEQKEEVEEIKPEDAAKAFDLDSDGEDEQQQGVLW